MRRTLLDISYYTALATIIGLAAYAFLSQAEQALRLAAV